MNYTAAPPPPHQSVTRNTKPGSRLTLRVCVWHVDGVPFPNFRAALAQTLEKADCGPQRGNTVKTSKPKTQGTGA